MVYIVIETDAPCCNARIFAGRDDLLEFLYETEDSLRKFEIYEGLKVVHEIVLNCGEEE